MISAVRFELYDDENSVTDNLVVEETLKSGGKSSRERRQCQSTEQQDIAYRSTILFLSYNFLITSITLLRNITPFSDEFTCACLSENDCTYVTGILEPVLWRPFF